MGSHDIRISAADLIRSEAFVIQIARELLSDPSDAADVAQETMLAALRSAPRRHERLRPWLRSVVRNFAFLRSRSERRRGVREEAASTPEAIPSTAEIAARLEMQRIVVEEVLALGDAIRDAIMLRYFEGMPPRLIAKRYGISTETVKTRLKRGRTQLRERLERRCRDVGENLGVALVALSRASHTSVAGASALGGTSLLGVLAMSIGTKAIAAMLIAAVIVPIWMITREQVKARAGVTTASTPVPSPRIENARPSNQSLLTDATRQADESVRWPVAPAGSESVAPHGIVVDESGKPIADAKLSIEAIPRERIAPGSGSAIASTTSDSDGHFGFRDAVSTESGATLVIVGHHANYAMGGVTLSSDEERRKDSVSVVLHQGSALVGRVCEATGRRPGIVGAIVEVWWFLDPDNASSFALPERERSILRARTDANGTYRIDGLPRGEVRLLATAEGFASVDRSVLVNESGASADFALVRGAEIAGRVVDAITGEPAATVVVGAQQTGVDVDGEVVSASGGTWWARATTNQRGEFRLVGLPRGRFNVMVLQLPMQNDPRTAAAIEGVELRDGDARNDIVLALKLGSEMVVRVVDADSTIPIAGVIVDMQGPARPASGTLRESFRTDHAGEVHWRVPEGLVSLSVRKGVGVTEGYSRVRGERTRVVAVAADSHTEVVFLLERATTIHGTVVDESGQAVVDAEVERLGGDAANDLSRINVRTDTAGRFTLSGFAAEAPCTLCASTATLAMPDPLVLAQGTNSIDGAITLRLRRKSSHAIRARFVNIDGAAAHAIVTIEEETGSGAIVPRPKTPCFSDARDGAIYVPGPWPGHRYRLRATAYSGPNELSVTSRAIEAETGRDVDFGTLVVEAR